MSRIPPLTLESAPAASRPLLEEARALAGGRLLNLHAVMAHSPAVLASYFGIRRATSGTTGLDARAGAAIMAAVSGVDGSPYTQAVTAQVASRAGWSEAESAELRAGRAGDHRLARLIAVARQAAARNGRVDDATWAAALAAGWSETDLVDAFAYISLTTYVDSFAHYAALALDVPAAPVRRP